MEKFSKKQKIFISFVFILYIVALFIFRYSAANGDGRFHARRMYDVYLSIKDEYFMSFIAKDLLNGFGYPTLGLYPYLLMIPFSLLQCKFTTEFTYVVYLLFLLSFSFFTSYIYAKKKLLFNIFPIFYILNPYLIFVFYNSWAGILAAYAVVPLIFLAVDMMFNNNKNGKMLLILSMSLLIYSHLISALITVLALAVYIVFNLKKMTKKFILEMVLSTITTICICAVAIFPTIEFLLSGIHGLNVYPYLGNSVIDLGNKSAFVFIFLIILAVYFMKNKKYLEMTALMLLVMCTNIFPWPQKLLNIIQAGHRVFLFSGLIFGLLLCKKLNRKALANIFLITPVVILCLYISVEYTQHPREHINGTSYINNVVAFDYVPENYTKKFSDNSVEGFIKRYEFFNKEKILKLNNGVYQLEENKIFFSEHNKRSILLPFLYYKGYEITIDGEYINNYEGEYGLIEINTDKEFGIITINYKGTVIQKFSKYLTIASALTFLAYLICININVVLWLKNLKKFSYR